MLVQRGVYSKIIEAIFAYFERRADEAFATQFTT